MVLGDSTAHEFPEFNRISTSSLSSLVIQQGNDNRPLWSTYYKMTAELSSLANECVCVRAPPRPQKFLPSAEWCVGNPQGTLSSPHTYPRAPSERRPRRAALPRSLSGGPYLAVLLKGPPRGSSEERLNKLVTTPTPSQKLKANPMFANVAVSGREAAMPFFALAISCH